MAAEEWMTLRRAWHAALYAPGGFYRTQQPADHFRTSSHASGAFADLVAELAARAGVDTVVDAGAGSGELLAALRPRATSLRLVGIDLRPRPQTLPSDVEWRVVSPEPEGLVDVVADVARSRPTLLLANELLDNVPCDLVELDNMGAPRIVEVSSSGRQRLGPPAADGQRGWLRRWWPSADTGNRAAVGLPRERLWRALCSAVPDGLCVAVDYGHRAPSRPFDGGLASYRAGRLSEPRLDGRHDVTADVAVDALAAAVGARLIDQADVVSAVLGPADRPDVETARTDPADYLRRLAARGERAELSARPGLGDFWWAVSGSRSGALALGVDAAAAAAPRATAGVAG